MRECEGAPELNNRMIFVAFADDVDVVAHILEVKDILPNYEEAALSVEK